jgi:adenylate cyclase
MPTTSSLTSDCLVCRTPLSGVLGTLGRATGIRRSAQNPNLCNRCDVHLQEGGIVEVGVFFADLTGYSRITRELGPDATHAIVDAYLRMAREVVVKWDGFVVQFAGDEIMALFNAPIQRADYAHNAVAAASEIQSRMRELSERFERTLQATVGISSGHARVGRQGSDDMKDYTAVGDVVIRAARLVANVEPGGILVDMAIFEPMRDDFPEAEAESMSLKGFDDPVQVVPLGGGVSSELDTAPLSSEGVQKPLRVTLLLAAVFGAPCAGLMVVNPLLIGIGIGALGVPAAALFLDQPQVRLPLTGIAILGALVHLVVIGRKRFQARASDESGGWSPVAGSPKGLAVSLMVVVLVGFELVAHDLMH